MLNLNSSPPSNNNVKRACANAEEMLNLNLPPPPSTMWSGLEKMLRKCLTPHNNIEGRRGGGGGDVKKISVETVAKRVNYFTFH